MSETSTTDSTDSDRLRQALRDWLNVPDAPSAPSEPSPPGRVLSAGDSVQDAYRDGHDCLVVDETYDPSVERWPIVLDIPEDRTVVLQGAGSAVTQLGEAAGSEPALRIIGTGAGNYYQAPTIRNLSIVGGSPGIEIQGTPYVSLMNLYIHADGDGVHVVEGPNGAGSYGGSCFNVQAWNCGGDGFSLERNANPHGFRFYHTHAIANKGIGFRIRGANLGLFGGSSQLNHNHGFELRNVMAPSILGAYIEGNGRANEYPVELYAKAAQGLTVADSYIHGINPRGTSGHDYKRVQRAINVHDSDAVSVRDNTFRRYGDASVAAFGEGSVDVFESTNYCDQAPLVSDDSGPVLSFGQPR